MDTKARQSTVKSQKPGRKRKAVQSLASPFIVATNQDTIKPNATSRMLIRHHVMKGKNRKDVSSQRTALRSWVNQGREFPLPQQTATKWLQGDSLANPLRLHINDPGLPIMGLKFNIEPCIAQVTHDCENIGSYFSTAAGFANIKSWFSHFYYDQSNVPNPMLCQLGQRRERLV
jgi:hypothetical protein